MSLLLTGASLVAATACGSDKPTSGGSAVAGEGGAETTGGAPVGGGAAGSGAGGSEAGGSEAGGAGGGSEAGGTGGGGEAGGAAGGSEAGGAAGGGDAGGAGGSEAGGAGGGPTGSHFSEHRLYQHLLEPFQTIEECQAVQVNCYEEVDFCPDGSVVIIVTDIQEPGTYGIVGDVIHASWPEAIEAPAELRFTILSPEHIVDDLVNFDWLLAEDASISYCPP